MTKSGNKRRSTGGVFIQILRSMAADKKETRVIKSDLNSIFKFETIKLGEKTNNIDPIMKKSYEVQKTKNKNFESQTLNSVFLKTHFKTAFWKRVF